MAGARAARRIVDHRSIDTVIRRSVSGLPGSLAVGVLLCDVCVCVDAVLSLSRKLTIND